MTDSWVDSLWIAIELIFVGVILPIALIFTYTAYDTKRAIYNEEAAVARAQEIQEWNRWEDTIVNGGDIIQLLAQSKGTPVIWVDTDVSEVEDFTKKFTVDSDIKEFNPARLQENIFTDIDRKFLSTIIRDDGGTIVRLEFTQ